MITLKISYMISKDNYNLIRAPKLSEQIAELLIKEITSARLVADEKLPSEAVYAFASE